MFVGLFACVGFMNMPVPYPRAEEGAYTCDTGLVFSQTSEKQDGDEKSAFWRQLPRMLAFFPVAAETLTRLNLQNTPQIHHGLDSRMENRESLRAGLANVFCKRPCHISVNILGFVGHSVSLQLLCHWSSKAAPCK